MVWFTCEECGDTIKKPKLQNHFYQCNSWKFSCVDCLQIFDRNSAKSHSVCVTEHEKYALGATKPGGFAANGLNREQAAKPQAAGDAEPTGLEFLTTRPPWKCTICNVGCTSYDTLMSHASGIKHKRKARAIQRAQSGGDAPQQQSEQQAAQEDTPAAAPAPSQPANTPSVLEDEDKFSALVKVVSKKLKRKGKLGPKKLKALSIKKLGVAEDELGELLGSIRDKLVSAGVAKLDGKKLLPA